MKNMKKLIAVIAVVGVLGTAGAAFAATAKTPAEIASGLTGKTVEDLYKERTAESMNVSRGTFQRIINAARKKTADALVHGKTIRIDGGNYQLSAGKACCRRLSGNCKRKGCEKCEDCEENKSEKMKTI